MVQAKLAEKRERRCDPASTHAETRHYPPGVTVRLSTSGKCPTECCHGEPKSQQQDDDRDRNSPTVLSRILAIAHRTSRHDSGSLRAARHVLDPQGPGQRGSAGGFQGLKEISLN